MINSIILRTIKSGYQIQTLTKGLNALSLSSASKPPTVTAIRTGSTSFFNKLPAEQIWKGVTSVSKAGKDRGRGIGKRKKQAKNLNKGQVIGVGKANIVWPGLNAPVIKGKELVQRQKLPEDPERETKLIKIRSEMGVFRPLKLSPIERGYTGAKMPGRSLGPPDAVGEDTFDGFDSIILEHKSVFHMSGNLGRKRSISALVVTGNKQGLAGFALGKAPDGRTALAKAKNRAGQKLMYIERYNDHTVLHDFYTQFGQTKIFVWKKAEGYGLNCHRVLKTICQMIGIKDLAAKVEGPTNVQHMTKAFFLGLLQQKTHEQLAEETGLHLVEFRNENCNYPMIVASPSECREDVEEPPDFTQYVMNNRVVLPRKKKTPFYAEYYSHKRYLWNCEKNRPHEKIRLQQFADYGELRSFLADQNPECSLNYYKQFNPKMKV